MENMSAKFFDIIMISIKQYLWKVSFRANIIVLLK